MTCNSPFGGATSRKFCSSICSKKTQRFIAIPSKHSMSYLPRREPVIFAPPAFLNPYLFAGISILSCGGSWRPSTIGRSSSVVLKVLGRLAENGQCNIRLHPAQFLWHESVLVILNAIRIRTKFEAEFIKFLRCEPATMALDQAIQRVSVRVIVPHTLCPIP